jgi:major outer membrane protein
MKKLVFTLLAFLSTGTVHALPIGNPAQAGLLSDGVLGDICCNPCSFWLNAFSFRIGYYGDFVFNKHMENYNGDSSDVEVTRIFTNAGYLALNICERFDVFGTLGATNLFYETELDFSAGSMELQTRNDFSWSVGVRGTLFECGTTYLGVEGQYFYTNPHISRVTESSTRSGYPSGNVNIKYYEWQIGLGLAHRIYNLVPYLGVRWGMSKLDNDAAMVELTINRTADLHNTRSKDNWGYAVGVTMVGCEKASLTVEGRFGGETAFYTNGQIRF